MTFCEFADLKKKLNRVIFIPLEISHESLEMNIQFAFCWKNLRPLCKLRKVKTVSKSWAYGWNKATIL